MRRCCALLLLAGCATSGGPRSGGGVASLPPGSPGAAKFTQVGLISLGGTRFSGTVAGPDRERGLRLARPLPEGSEARPQWMDAPTGRCGEGRTVCAIGTSEGDEPFRTAIAENRAILEVYGLLTPGAGTPKMEMRGERDDVTGVDTVSTKTDLVVTVRRFAEEPRIGGRWRDPASGAVHAYATYELASASPIEVDESGDGLLLLDPAKLAALAPDAVRCDALRKSARTLAAKQFSSRAEDRSTGDQSAAAQHLYSAEHLDGLLVVLVSRLDQQPGGAPETEEWEAIYDVDALLDAGVCKR